MPDFLPGSAAASKFSRLLFLVLLFVLPLWVGATGTTARLALFLSAGILLLLLLRRRLMAIHLPPGVLPLSLFCLWLLLQCLPLPPVASGLLQPGYSDLVDKGANLLSQGDWRPLSVYPQSTFNEFWRFTACLAFYLAATNLLISSRSQLRLLFWFSGFFGFYAFLGLAQFFAPTDQILWFFADWPEAGRFFATYVNGNHYAGLVGMVFPLLVISLLLNTPRAGYGSLRDKLTDIFTDRELNLAILLGLTTIIVAVSIFFSLSQRNPVPVRLVIVAAAPSGRS